MKSNTNQGRQQGSGDRADRRHRGEVKEAIVEVLKTRYQPTSIKDIEAGVNALIGACPPSSIRSYLRLNTPTMFARMDRAEYMLKANLIRPLGFDDTPASGVRESVSIGRSKIHHADCISWLRAQPRHGIHAVVTDPPYGLFEYTDAQQAKLRAGKGGVWRIPPSFDGAKRAPLPRFTVLDSNDLRAIDEFFFGWATALLPVLVPGANVVVASNPLLSYVVSAALARAGLERRGEIVRLVMTMRGGDRPKSAHEEFPDVSVMPRSMWEPWLVFRRPLDGRVQDNLRKWGTGGFRRPSSERPFGDVITSSPTRATERAIANHPSLKPQAFMRQVVRAALPLGSGLLLDPFCGSGSTLAAANHVGYDSVGIERDATYFDLAVSAIPRLGRLQT